MASLETHRALLEQLSQPGQPLGPDSPYRTVQNPQFFKGARHVTPARRQLHRALIEGVLAQGGEENQALIISGPPGAGKSTVRRQELGDISLRFATIDADMFKEELINASLREGAFEEVFYSPEIRQLQQEGHIFHPFEFASLVHDESSMLVKQAFNEAYTSGTNIILDGVGASERTLNSRLERLTAAGYNVSIIDVECPREVSEASIQQRWEHGRTEALNNNTNSSLGGRWVPSAVLEKVFPNADGPSAPEVAHQNAAHAYRVVSTYQLWRRSSPTVAHNLEQDLVRAHHGATLIDKDAAQALNTAFGARPRPHQRSTDTGQGL